MSFLARLLKQFMMNTFYACLVMLGLLVPYCQCSQYKGSVEGSSAGSLKLNMGGKLTGSIVDGQLVTSRSGHVDGSASGQVEGSRFYSSNNGDGLKVSSATGGAKGRVQFGTEIPPSRFFDNQPDLYDDLPKLN